MLVKGIIVEQVKQIVDDNYKLLNRYNVRIPVFEAQGANTKAIMECGLIFQPGNNLGYEIGDVVVVAFENNDLNAGLILGKLYTEDSSSSHRAESNPFNLTVENNAVLPKSTLVGGFNVFDEIVNIKNKLNALDGDSESSGEYNLWYIDVGDNWYLDYQSDK